MNDKTESKPDPFVCPLCGEGNSCLNLGEQDVSRSCWCNDPNIAFPEGLLSQIPQELRRKACVCKSCVLAYKNT